VSFSIDVSKAFGLPLDPGWNMRVLLTDFRIQGVLDVGVHPRLSLGMVSMGADFSVTIADLNDIVVGEYCQGAIEGCEPGVDEMPVCPQAPDGEFFDEIPQGCDVNILGFGVRMLLGLVTSVPGAEGAIKANVESHVPQFTQAPQPGGCSPLLFDVSPGGNCEAVSR